MPFEYSTFRHLFRDCAGVFCIYCICTGSFAIYVKAFNFICVGILCYIAMYNAILKHGRSVHAKSRKHPCNEMDNVIRDVLHVCSTFAHDADSADPLRHSAQFRDGQMVVLSALALPPCPPAEPKVRCRRRVGAYER